MELETGAVFGYEALARDATGTFPAAAFEAARQNGSLAALEWECRARAIEGALAAGLRPPLALFVNNEPSTLDERLPDHLRPLFLGAVGSIKAYAEITERAIADRPAELIRAIGVMRSMGLCIAIDDVGVDPHSLAMLPVIKPDVIKLDLSLVQAKPGVKSAAVMTAVRAHAAATGAIILAEGIETEHHLLNARALGATLGQGWLFGHPGALPQRRPIRLNAPTGRIEPPPIPEPEVPTAIVGGSARMTPGNKAFLIEISKYLEQEALAQGKDTVVVSCFQHERFFTGATRDRYAKLAETVGVVVALGEGMPLEPAPGVRGGALDATDGLVGEWTVAVLGPHFCAALIARDLGDSGPEADRRFDFTMTFDPAEIGEIVTALLARVKSVQPVAIPIAA